MPERKLVNINDMPKWFKALYILAPVLGVLLITNQLDNDFFFIYKTGEFVTNNGFPTTDFLSMHGSMHIIVQQWLSAVIYYFLYSKLGEFGAIAFVYVCYALFCVLMHKLTRLITDNLFVASMFSFVADVLAATMFETTRPQAMTFLLILLAVYMLECFVQKGKTVYLCVLPVISLALINLHAAMWLMLFVFAAPYAAAALPIKLGKIKLEPCCSFIKLLVCGAACFGVGFVNPYGIEAMKYIFTSFGYDEINKNINEMAKTSAANSSGTVFFIVLAAFMCLAIFAKKKAFSTRFVLLFLGTTLMAFMNLKSIAYFIVGGVPAFSYMLKDAEIKLPVDEKKPSDKKDSKKLRMLIVAFAAMIVVLVVALVTQAGNTQAPENEAKSEYAALDEIVAILDKEDKDDVVLFAGFNQGQYFEFYGYHPYIDGRAELFLEDNNKEYNYLKEYFDLEKGKIYYRDFVDKYDFNYLVVDNAMPYLSTSLEHDSDFELVYTSDYAKLFKLKDNG
ncbi:MAG: hypothetical protein E7571_01310 [Ruminococcaceae bacterium]|nr:hypothetical protein [Oscillospiraceae bacterium]